MSTPPVKCIIETALLAAGEPLNMAELQRLLDGDKSDVQEALEELREDWRERGFRLVEVADGWQFITNEAYMEYLRRLRPKKNARLSRQLMEVLAIIAYQQPATRGDIEQIRGVSVSSGQLAALEELAWIEEVGRKETPGRPILYGTTNAFLNDLAISSLDELPQPEPEDIDAGFEDEQPSDSLLPDDSPPPPDNANGDDANTNEEVRDE